MTGVIFLRIGFLWLLPLAVAVWFWPRRARDARHAGLRSALLVALVLALAEPVSVRHDPGEHHVLVLDRSTSVAAGDAAPAAALAPPDAASTTLVAAGGDAPDDARSRFDRVVQLGGAGSPLSAALFAADRAIPPGARGSVTLATDGLATDRRWGPALQRLSARGLPVHALPLSARDDGVRPVAVDALGTWRVGHTARALVRLAGDAAATVALVGPAGELARATGEDAVLLEFEPSAAGFLPLRAVVGAHELRRTFAVQDPLRVLYLGRSPDGAARLRELLGKGFSLDARNAPPGSLEGWDLVVADDLPADRFPEAAQRALVAQVTDGGVGFAMTGGEGAFGPGGYHDTVVADILPTEFVQKEEKRDPSTTLVVIIDTSGSMGGTRVQLAKEVARLAMRRLLPHDKVGIVEFYGAKRWAAPIQPASNAIEIQRALNRLQAGGGTVILPAIEEAYYGLQNIQTRYKHVLVLTDGGVEQGAFEPLLRKMSRKGMNVSTVLIGAQAHSEFLVNMAQWGKGRFYSVPDRFNLPEVILKQPTTARLPAYRRGVHPVQGRGGSGWWGGVDPRDVPPLAGYVETRARPGAEVLVETVRGAHPVLATWRFGLGRVTTLLTEPAGGGTEPWKDWDGYGAFLARVLARTARGGTEPFVYTLRRDDHLLRLTARRTVAAAVRPAARLLGEGDTPFRFRARADGVFTAELAFDPEREARVVAGAVRLVSSARADVAPEHLVDPRGALDLDRVTAETGGRRFALGEAFSPAAGGAGTAQTLRVLWPWLFLLSLLVYLGDIAYRRWPTGGRET